MAKNAFYQKKKHDGKVARKGIKPTIDPVCETKSEIKIAVQDTLDKLLSNVSDESTGYEDG